MSTIIQIKRSSGTSAPSTLKLGELAYTYGTGTQGNLGDRLFIGEGGVDGNGDANNITVIVGQYFTDQLDHAQGTLTASSALLVDSNKAIDEIFIGNSSSTGGTLKLNEGTSNGTNFIGLKAPNSVTTSTTFTLPDGDGTNGQILTTDGSGNLTFSSAAAGTFTLSADSGSDDTFTTGNTLTFAGGTGIDTTVSNDQISIAIDSTVPTNAGTQTLTNKTINTANNTITIVEADISDLGSYITASSTDTLTNKTFDANGTGNSISNIEVADLASGVLDTDLASVSASDDTLASAKAIKAYVDTQTASQMTTFTISDDSSTTSTITQSDTLQFLGGTGIGSTVSGDTVTFAIDNSVATLTGSQELTNKTINASSNTISNITNANLSGSAGITNANLANSTITITGGDASSDAVALGETITFTGGEGIDTAVTNNTLTIAAEDATSSNKGIASFDATDFTVSSGDVTLNTERVQDIAGAMFTSNTETLITATYQDADGTIDLVVDNDLSNYDNTTSDFATVTGTETLTNKTLTAPKFADGGFIADSNGNEQIVFNTTASAVNYLDVTNAATGNGITLASAGGDTNIDIKISPKGSGVIDADTSRITNVTDPSGDQDAATKAYVDSVANGLDVKDSVRYASTANVAGTYDNGAGTITAGSNGAFSIDGQTPSQGDRVLLKDQSSAVQNGLYIVTTVGDGSTAYVLTRTPDADAANEITGGAFVFVEEGSANADNGYVFTHNGTPTLGSTDITVAQFSGAGQISAGDALTKTGNTLDVAVDDTTIEVSGDALQVKASGIGTNQLAATAVTEAKIANNAVTVAKLATTLDLSSNTITLPSSFVTTTGTQTLTNKTISGASNTLTSIGNASLTNSTITLTGDSGTNAIDLGDTITVSGTANEIETSVSGDTLTIGLPDDVTIGNNLSVTGNTTITGNLTVNGTTTTVNSTAVNIQNAFTFEGASADAYETTLTVVDPTADHTISLPNASGTIVLRDTTDTLTNKTISGVSNTLTNIGNSSLTNSAITISDGSTTQDLDLGNTLTITSGEGIDAVVSATDTLTISAEEATSSNKGVASFNSTDFTVTSGAVTLNAERVQDIAGAMFSSNTETLITATYQDADGTIDLVVDNDLSNYD